MLESIFVLVTILLKLNIEDLIGFIIFIANDRSF